MQAVVPIQVSHSAMIEGVNELMRQQVVHLLLRLDVILTHDDARVWAETSSDLPVAVFHLEEPPFRRRIHLTPGLFHRLRCGMHPSDCLQIKLRLS